MAEEITLNAYIERIENMIRQGRMDEAIAHAAHVLQFYPKNAAVYRNMGRALMRQQRYEEAGEIFRRLLAAIPDDFSSHYQLSIIYENENRPDASLWHIERAFDVQPGSTQVNDRLRELYKKFRDVDVDKIQLTAGAVANQYVKAGMHAEALELLDRTLKKVPDRADLQLIKARALWSNDDHVEAAEVALDVINSYPFAVDANRIMTELWLEAERPSDAQRYLSRVEAIDPFLAYELATGDVVDHKRFKVEELDFARYAATLASQEDAPDWLENIEELVEAEAAADDADISMDDFDFDDEPVAEAASDDWLNELQDEAVAAPVTPPKKVTDDLSDLLPDDFNFPDSAGTDDTVKDEDIADFSLFDDDNDDALFDDLASEGTGLTDLLGELEEAGDSGDFVGDDGTGLTGLLGEDDYGSPAAEAENLTGLLGKLSGKQGEGKSQTDDLSWLDEVADGQFDASHDEDDIFADIDAPAQTTGKKPDTDPLAWLNDDALLDSTDSGEFDEMSTDDLVSAIDEDGDDDPMAWLSDDNLLGDTARDEDDLFGTDDLAEPESAAVNPDDPTAWMQGSGIDFDEDADVVSPLFAEDNDPVSLESDEVDPMAWLGGDDDPGDDLFGTDELEDLVSDSEENPMAWLEDEGLDFERTGEFEGLNTDELEDSDDDDSMAWLDDSQVEITDEDDFVASETDDLLTDQLLNIEDTEDTAPIEGDPMEWLQDDGVEFFEDDTADDDWFSDDSALDDLLNIADLTNTTGEEPVDDLLIDTEMQETMIDQPDDSMDWLNADDSEDEETEPVADEDPMAWLSEAGVDLDDDSEDGEFDPRAGEDPMAWLTDGDDELEEELNPEDYPTNELDLDDEHEELDWLEVDDVQDDEPAAQPSSMLDFLNDNDNDMELPDIDPLSEDDSFEEESDWLRALDGEEPVAEAQAEELLAGDFDDFGETGLEDLDWGDADDSADDGFDWDFGEAEEEEALDWMSDEAEAAGDAEPAEADWLTGLDIPEPVAEDSGFDDFDFGEEADEDAEPAEADWLANLDDAEPVDEDSGFDDFDFGEEADELEPAEADWLTDLDSPEPVAEDSGFDDFDFGEEADDLEPAEADWLADLDSPEPVAEDSGFDDFDFGEEADEELEPAEADWLADIDSPEPVAEDSGFDDFDFGEEADEELESAEADWLTDLDSPEPVAEEDSGFDDFDFDEEADELEPAEADWLADIDSPEPVAEQESDWGDVGAGFTDELDAEPVAEQEGNWEDLGPGFTDELDAENADWLSEATEDAPEIDDFDFEDISEEDLAEPEGADWLANLDDEEIAVEESGEWGVIGSGFTDELEEQPETEEDGWGELGKGFTDELEEEEQLYADPEPGTEPVAEEAGDWLDDIGIEEQDAWSGEEEEIVEEYNEPEEDYDLNVSSTTGMTGMLQSIRVSRGVDDSPADNELPPWLEDAEESLPELEPEMEMLDDDGWEEESDYQEVVYEDDAAEEPVAEDDFFEEDFEEEEEAIPLAEEPEAAFVAASVDEDDYEEEVEVVDADNAPDWLNAMVPGLDLDFEAEDEGYLDEGFDERDNTLRERNINESATINSDFEWLQDIVEEESGMMEIIEDDYASNPPPPPMPVPRRGFEFSAPPVWARGEALQNLARGDDPIDAVPDYLSGFEEDFESAQDYEYDGEFEDNFEFETDEVVTQDDEFNIEDNTATTVNDSLTVENSEFEGFDDEFAGDFDDFDDAFDDDFDDFDFDDEFDDEFDDQE